MGLCLERKRSIRVAYRGFAAVRPKLKFICIELSHSFSIDLLCVVSVILLTVFGCLYHSGKMKIKTDDLNVKIMEFSQKEKEYLKSLIKKNDEATSNELKALRSEIDSIKNLYNLKKIKK